MPLRARRSPTTSCSPAESRAAGIRARARRVLLDNWREGVRTDGTRYGFTCPGPPRYRHQWYWDSCFHAIVWRHFEPRRAREELRTLIRAGTPAGRVPHTTFWDRPAGWRRMPWYATRRPFGESATATTQTPLLALAWERVAEVSYDDPAFREEGLDALCRHYDWLATERDPDRDGLVSIIHPDESGLDDSPKYEPAFGRMTHDRPGYFWLVTRSARVGYRSSEIFARWDEHVEDVLFNVGYALSLRALSRLLGEPSDGTYAARAHRTERALLSRCHDPASGLFWDLAGADERRVRISTWSSLAPLALSSLPADVRRRLVEDHLLHHRRYLAPVGVPSVALEESSFRPGFDRFRCWRGPSWMNTAWWLVPAMRDLGYRREADRIVESLVGAVERFGFREYYDPFGRRGFGARRFSWSTLLIELL